ncbi:hypothetical protein K438DRAFT_1976511 [Mycena galopus ATCC 62051]|nr:hypothetical protein K438DRAFT_1976511 [Mycena galopus ATCC 62051]
MFTDRSNRRPSPLNAPQAQRPPFLSAESSFLDAGGQQNAASSGVYESSRTTFQSSSGGTLGIGGGLQRGPSRGPGGGGPPGPPRGPSGRRPGDDGDGPDVGPGSIISRNGGELGEQRMDLIEFLTSQLLKLTVVAQPDLQSLLTHPALRRLIMDIALQASHMATTDALAQMQAEMQRMQEQMQNWMEDAMRLSITKTMDIELNPLARNSAAYSLGALTRMKRKQIAAYNSFAPEIGAPEIVSPHEDID